MKKGLKTLIAGIITFITGAFVIPIAIILPFFLNDSDEQLFIIPGDTEVEINKPGRHYLWNNFQTIYKGKNYNQSKDLPNGLSIIVTNEAGQEIQFSSDTSTSYSSGSSSSHSIGYIEVSSPGKVTVSVAGTSEDRVFSFSRSHFMKIFGLIFGGVAISILLSLTGLGISIWGIIKLVNTPNKEVTAHHP